MKFASTIRDYVLIAVIYLVLILVLPANHMVMQQYHLSSMQLHILYFSVALPLVAIWFTAFYAAGKLWQYSKIIHKTPEGEGFKDLAQGTTWLAWSLPISALITLLAGALSNNHPSVQNAGTVIANYVTLAFAFGAFTLFARGARSLTSINNSRLSLDQSRALIVIFLLLGVAFCYLTFRSLNLHSLTSSDNHYFLPVWLLITTFIVPYLYAWFSGLLAAYELIIYNRKVSGVLYRQSMNLLAFGSVGIIAASVAAQYLVAALPRNQNYSLSEILLFVNILYILMGAGYIMISIGASRLKRIEEI